MATKEVTFQNYNAETGEYFTDTKTCTVVDSSYNKGTLGSRDIYGEYWYVVDSSINLGWINVGGDVHLILSDGCTLTVDEQESSYSAVNVEESDSFTVYGQEAGTGKLVAKGGKKGAGIGGDKKETNGTITINGGVIEAYGGKYAAGIGGGYEGDGRNITINGGSVTATGGWWGAGLGGGDYGYGYNITINGGTVKATTEYSAAGIGGGYDGQGHDITINGGDVTAAGDWSAGIGGGFYSQGYNITINGGKVTAEASNYGAGIGGGDYKAGHDITINGGEVTATGATWAAGIGGGYDGDGYNIFINGGTVVANGGELGSGIGGGIYAAGHDIIIKGGDVTSIGEGPGFEYSDLPDYEGGAGIGGGGYGGNGYNISIYGGTVTAFVDTDYTHYAGAGIGGGGTQGSADGIYIYSGDITADGGPGAAGIGGNGDAKDITINGGKVAATGGEHGSTTRYIGAGIGGGCRGDANNVHINGGNIVASSTGGSTGGSAVGSGNETPASSQKIYFNEDVVVLYGKESASTALEHTSDTDVTKTLDQQHYLTAVLSNTTLDTETELTESVTFTRSGGVVGNGGYYNITETGSLTNTSYIVTFDGTSTTGNGGALYSEGTVTLANTTFSECYTANGCGGAIYNQGGTVTLTDVEFDSNTSVYGGGSASGGAIYTNGGTLSVVGSGTPSVFKNNESWDVGGAIVVDGGANATLDNVSFASNTSRSGGAAAVSNGTMTVTNATFKSNEAKILGITGGLGGAALVSENGTLNLANVTFEGNTATSGGAVYTEKGGKVSLTGNVYLSTATDTIVNQGTLDWDLTGTSGSTGYLSDFSLLTNNGNLTITVNANEKFMTTYLLASNGANAAGKTFTLTGVSGVEDETITVGGDTVIYNKVPYKLSLNTDNTLELDAVFSVTERIVVSDKLVLSNFEAKDLSNPELDGGVLMVESTGNLSVFNSTFKNNTGKNGGAIYNEGTTTLSNVTFNGNEADKGGAIYNAGTLTLNGAVTLSTANDTITNTGNLVWNITTSSCGYLSDWSRLTNSGSFTITGAKDNTCGQFVLADNAATAVGQEFTFKVDDYETKITVSGEEVKLNNIYYAGLAVNSQNELVLTVEPKRVVVEDGKTVTIQDGAVFNLTRMEAYYKEGALFYVDAGGMLTNSGMATIIGAKSKESGGAIYNSGTVKLSKMAFRGNQSANGGALYSDGSEVAPAAVTLENTTFTGNSASSNGGALVVKNTTLSLTNVNFVQNTAVSGGALYSDSSNVNLDNVIFRSNSAVSDTVSSGAIYSNNSTLNLLGKVMLATESDTIYNCGGTISWKLDHSKNGYVSNYALLANDPDGTFAIEADNADVNTCYVLAGNAESASQKLFKLFDGTITVNGESVGKDGIYYTAYINSDNDLRLSITQRMVIDGTSTTLVEGLLFTNNNTEYDGDGGSIEVKNSGTLVAKASENTPLFFTKSRASGNGGAVCITSGTAEFGNVNFVSNSAANGGALFNQGTVTFTDTTSFSDNTASGNGGAIYNQGTINLAGTVKLSTSSDQWYNADNSRVNWNLSSSACTIAYFEQYINANDSVRQTITVTEKPTEGDYVLATGNMTGYGTDSTGKYTFYATMDGGTLSDAITVDAENPVIFEGYRYSLTVNNNDTPEEATDDKLVLSVEKVFGADVDDSLQDKWFKAGEEVTIFGSYTSADPVTITVEGKAAEVDAKNMTWSYTFASKTDTTGQAIRILCKSENDKDITLYTLKVDTMAPEVMDITVDGKACDDEWMKIQPDTSVMTITLVDMTSGVNEERLSVIYDEAEWTKGTQYTYDAATGELTTVAGCLSEGTHTLTVQGYDNAGNLFTETLNLKLDATAPSISNVTVNGYYYDDEKDRYWFKQDATGTVTAQITDTLSGVKTATFNDIVGVKGENDIYTFALDTSSEKSFDGKKVFAIDNAGNTAESTKAYNYSIDGTAPTISVSHTQVEGYPSIVNVTATVEDDGSGVHSVVYSLDGSKWVDYTDTFAATNNGIIYFKAVDHVGNQSTERHVLTDTIPPTVTIIADTATLMESVNFSVEATDIDSNIIKLEYSTDGGANWNECTIEGGKKSVSVSLNAETNNTTYLFRAYDGANNVGRASVTFNNIYKGFEESFDIIGIKDIPPERPIEADTVTMIEGSLMTVEEGASVDVGTLVMNGKDIIINNGSVAADVLSVNSQQNLISGNIIDVKTITFTQGAELGIHKDQFDSFMDNSTFETADGKLIVSSSTGNPLRTSTVDTLMNKENIGNVAFKQDLIDVNKLNIKNTKKTTIAFEDAYGTTSSDTIRFYEGTDVVFGAEGRVIDLGEGSNTIQIDKNAVNTIESNLVNVSKVTSASGSTVTMANITFQVGRSATLKAEGTSFIVQNVTGSDKTTQITVGKNSKFEAAELSFLSGKDKFSVGACAQAIVSGSIDGINKLTLSNGKNAEQMTTLTAGDATGLDDKNDTVKFGNYAKATLGEVNLKGGTSDKLSVGSDSILEAKSISNVETVSVGARSDAQIGTYEGEAFFAGAITGVNKLTLSNGKNAEQMTRLTTGDVTGLDDKNDTVKFGNYAKATLGEVNLKGGTSDKLSVGSDSILEAKSISNVETVSVGARSNAQIGTYEGEAFLAGAITGVNKLTLSNGKNAEQMTRLTTGDVTGLDDKNDTVKFGNYAKATLGEVNLKGGTSDKLSVGSDSILEAKSIANVETISFGSRTDATFEGNITGVNKLTLSNGKDASQKTTLTAGDVTGLDDKNDTIQIGNWSNVTLGAVDLKGSDKGKSDKLTVGSDSIFNATNIAGAETVSIGSRTAATVTGSITGVNKLTLSNGKNAEQMTTFKVDSITGTDSSDTFSIGNYADVNVHGLIDFEGETGRSNKDQLTVGSNSQVVLKATEEGVKSLTKFTVGKNSTAYLSSELKAKVTSTGKAATIFDIGSSDVAKNFVDAVYEGEDNTFDDRRTVGSQVEGWLCNDDSQFVDAIDYIAWDNKSSATFADTAELKITQYDVNGDELEGTAIDGNVLIKANNAVAFSVAFGDVDKKGAIKYTISNLA